jgi:hypothetical protein
MATTTIGLGEERTGGNEDALITQIMEKNLETLAERGNPTARAQHPKQHGCARAVFEVRADVPPELRHGIFATPRRFDALIRFSNGLQADDREADVHGMAIKLLDVPGRKLLPGHEDSTTMDFVLVDHPSSSRPTLRNTRPSTSTSATFSLWRGTRSRT